MTDLLSVAGPGLASVGTVVVLGVLARAFPEVTAPSVIGMNFATLRRRNRWLYGALHVLFFLPLAVFVPLVNADLVPNDRLFAGGLMWGSMVMLPALGVIGMTVFRGRARLLEFVVYLENTERIGRSAHFILAAVFLISAIWALWLSVPPYIEWLRDA